MLIELWNKYCETTGVSIPTKGEKITAVNIVLYLAEKYFDRIDTNTFLEMLSDVPLTDVFKFLKLSIEYNNNKKRNLQVRLSFCDKIIDILYVVNFILFQRLFINFYV